MSPSLRTLVRLLCIWGPALFLATCGDASRDARQMAPATDAPATQKEARTNIRLAKRNADGVFIEGITFTRDTDHVAQILPALYQNEGPAWENENIAFRMYWDVRNGIDVHGKKVRDLVLDTVGLDHNNYHEMSDWGMDVLKVGNSLGAGAIALRIDGDVYRIGDAPRETVRIVEETPERSAFLLRYEGLELGGRRIDLDWEIGIDAGTHHYDATVTATGLTGGEELLVGIVNLHADTLYTLEREGRFVAYTHGPQAELDHYLGLGVSVDLADYLAHSTFAPDERPISSTYYVRVALENGQPTAYRFTAGWAPGHAAFRKRPAFAAVLR